MTNTSFLASIPPLPCELTGVEDLRESVRWVLTAAKARTLPHIPDAWQSEKFSASVLLPDGDRLGFQLTRSEIAKVDETLWRLVSQVPQRAGLRFWGLVADNKESTSGKIWIHSDPPLKPDSITFESFKHPLKSGSVDILRVDIRQADRHAVRLVADGGDDDAFQVRHLLPLYDSRGDLSCELVSVKTTSHQSFPVHVFYPPDLTAVFWHYLSNQLHDGAAIIGQEILNQTKRNQTPKLGSLVYSAGIFCLRYGSGEQAAQFLSMAKGFKGASGVARGIERIRALIAADFERTLSHDDRDALISGLIAASHLDLPASTPELSQLRDTVTRYLDRVKDDTLAEAEARYRNWARRVDSESITPGYDSVDLSGPATPLPERESDRGAVKALAKKKSGSLILAAPR